MRGVVVITEVVDVLFPGMVVVKVGECGDVTLGVEPTVVVGPAVDGEGGGASSVVVLAVDERVDVSSGGVVKPGPVEEAPGVVVVKVGG